MAKPFQKPFFLVFFFKNLPKKNHCRDHGPKKILHLDKILHPKKMMVPTSRHMDSIIILFFTFANMEFAAN
jgi:hypothetical protein